MKGNLFIVKKAGLLTKLVVALILIYVLYTMVTMQGRIAATTEDISGLSQQVEAQVQRNAELQDAIDNSNDDEQKKDIARERLGLLSPGEKVFHFAE